MSGRAGTSKGVPCRASCTSITRDSPVWSCPSEGSRARHHRQRPDRSPAGRSSRLRDPRHPGRAGHVAARISDGRRWRWPKTAVRCSPRPAAGVRRRPRDQPAWDSRDETSLAIGCRRRGHHPARRGHPGARRSPGVVRLPGRRRHRPRRPAWGAHRAAVRAADQRVGRLLAAVRSRLSHERENWTIVVVTDHGHLDRGGHGGREPEVATAWAAAAGPGIWPGAPPLISRQEEVAPLVLAAACWSPGQG